jgi:3D (Asp-Asp-Asp) domain-containing protein
MRKVPAIALAALGAFVALPSKAYTKFDRYFVTAYTWADNSPAGDGIAKSGLAGDGRARISTDNRYDNPTTLAVKSGGVFQPGARVLVSDLGWFVVEDICAGCTDTPPPASATEATAAPNVDMWTGYAHTSEAEAVTAFRSVEVWQPNELDGIPSDKKALQAGAEWHATVWADAAHRPNSSATLYIDNHQPAIPYYSAAMPPELTWANLLVDGLIAQNDASRNVYGSPAVVRFGPPGGAADYYNQTKCSSFVTQMMKQGRSLSNQDIIDWFAPIRSTASPYAHEYYYAVVQNLHYSTVTSVPEIARGDLIAIIYGDGTGDPTGHTAFVNTLPTPMSVPAKPVLAGTTQYVVEVVDSTSVLHSDDTRAATGGAGRGTLRLYADGTGLLLGYAWSTRNGTFYRTDGSSVAYDGTPGTTSKKLVVGRYVP